MSASAAGDIRIGGELDRRRAEALALEIRALARRFGLDVGDLRIVAAEDAATAETAAGADPGAEPPDRAA